MSLAQVHPGPLPTSTGESAAAGAGPSAAAAAAAAAAGAPSSSSAAAAAPQQQQPALSSASSSAAAAAAAALIATGHPHFNFISDPLGVSSSSSYLGIGAGITPAATSAATDDASFQLDFSINSQGTGLLAPPPAAAAAIGTSPFPSTSSATGLNYNAGAAAAAAAAAASTSLDNAFLKVGGTAITFDFPSLPDGLLDEAPEYEYSAHTKANVFEAAQDYLADVDGARVFDLDSFDPSLAGLGGDESLWSFADTLDLGLAASTSSAHLPQHHVQDYSHLASASSAQLSDPFGMTAIASSAAPHLHSGLPDHHVMGSHSLPDTLGGPSPGSSAATPAGTAAAQYALNYLHPNNISGTQTAPAYPAVFHGSSVHPHSSSNHQHAQHSQYPSHLGSSNGGGGGGSYNDFGLASSGTPAAAGEESFPASKRRRGMSPRTAPLYDESGLSKMSPFQQQQQQQQQQGGHLHSTSGLMQPPASRPMPGPGPYPTAYNVPYGHGGTPASSSRSRMTSWQGSPYPGGMPHSSSAEWGVSADPHGSTPAHGPPPPPPPGHLPSMVDPNASTATTAGGPSSSFFVDAHRLSEVSLASSSGIGPGGAVGGPAITVPSGGGYMGTSGAGGPNGSIGVGVGGPRLSGPSSTAASLGLVPVVGVPVGPGSTTIAIGPSASQQAEIIHSLGQALESTSDADGVARCPYPNCNKTFAKNRTYNLKAHLRSHSQLKPFACASCPRAFSRKHDLERHARVHSGDKPYICEVCGRGFPRSDALRRHWRVEKECGQRAAELEAQQNGALGPNALGSGSGGGGASSDENYSPTPGPGPGSSAGYPSSYSQQQQQQQGGWGGAGGQEQSGGYGGQPSSSSSYGVGDKRKR
ncbi:hypothetical protein OC835_000609 [Tilletia horrida]|nr:hypothetical protein OC835_000609 [Tilletia horrida]